MVEEAREIVEEPVRILITDRIAQQVDTLLRDAVGNQNAYRFFNDFTCFLNHPCSSPLSFEASFTQPRFQLIHSLHQIGLLEEAKMAHTNDLAIQLLLAAREHDIILLAQRLQ